MISVIITTYKRDLRILKRAVDSAINQSYKDIEIIIINDYPANQKQIDVFFRDYNVTIIHNEENMGACRSRNRGIDIAKGEYIALLDDDDEWVISKLKEQLAVIEEGYDLVYCNAIAVKQDGTVMDIDFIEDCGYPPIKKIIAKNCIGGCSFPLIRKKVLVELGGFDENFKSSQDHDMWIRIAEKYRIAYIDKKLVKYYIMGTSITSNMQNRVQGYDRILSKHRKLLKENKVAASRLLFQYIEVFLKLHRKDIALHYIKKSFIVFPANIIIPFLEFKHIYDYAIRKIKGMSK